jgi:hypothetical protein
LPQPEIELNFLGHSAHSLFAKPTEILGYNKIIVERRQNWMNDLYKAIDENMSYKGKGPRNHVGHVFNNRYGRGKT